MAKAKVLRTPIGTSRRRLLQAGAALGVLQVTAPFILSARGEATVKMGMVNPLTGAYAALARSEVDGAKLAVDQINAKGGILGRQAELLVEDSANDVGIGVQKTRKLIDRDEVDFVLGDVNSAIAYAMMGVTNEKKKLHIVPGGHTDPITGKDCKWNAFRVCNTTAMDANANSGFLMDKFGKRWYFLVPDYAYGHTLQAAFEKNLKAAGGTVLGADLVPIGTADYSAYLIKAQQAKPDVLISVMGGADAVNSLKQIVQFGLHKQFAVGGGLQELENLLALPNEARIGWWIFEWYWNQPKVPEVANFVAEIKKRTNAVATARHWFGFVAVHSIGLVANEVKSLDGVKLAHALEGLVLPPEVALQPGKIFYRPGNHELMASLFAGEAHGATGDPNDLFRIDAVIPGEKAEGPVEGTGCHLSYPA
ncbi:MAG: ABC transporter substrate-binding protein [Alphaproteobacteria bacterium]